MLLRTLHCIGIIVTLALGPWFVAVPWMIFYIIWWRGFEIILIAFLVDSFYGGSFPVPLYSTIVLFSYIVWATVRPRLLLYTSR